MAFGLIASPVVGIALNRGAGPDFSERDRAVLEALRPHLRRAYLTAATVGRLGEAIERGGQAAIVVSRDGAVQTLTEQAERWLAAYFPRGAGELLPDDVAAWLRRRQAFRAAEDDLPPPLDPLTAARDGARLLISYLPGRTPAEPDLLLLEERREDPARRFGLSTREAEVLQHLALGQTDAEIAAALVVSPRTIQAHLARVYRKLGVSHRTAALAKWNRDAPA